MWTKRIFIINIDLGEKRNNNSAERNNSLKKNKPTVISIHRASNILVCLINGKNTVTDIANNCGLSKSTVHRLLKALIESDFVLQDPINHRYYIGNLFTRLASNLHTIHEHLIRCAIEEMKNLSDVAEETIALSIHVGLQHIRLHEIPSKHALKVTEVDKRMEPLYAGATAKVLLSQLDDNELKEILKIAKVERLTENTITDKEKILMQVKQAREEGYAISCGEVFIGAFNISAPIKDYICPAALNILGPEHRLKSKATEIAKELKASVTRIEKKLL